MPNAISLMISIATSALLVWSAIRAGAGYTIPC